MVDLQLVGPELELRGGLMIEPVLLEPKLELR